MSAPSSGLVVVSAGLGLAGGGSAALGRLIATSAHAYCRERRLSYGVLHLGSPEPALNGLPVRHFAGHQKALALAITRVQGGRCHALLFDHLGPARVQALLPRPLRSRYAVFLLGVEMAARLGWDRRRSLSRASIRLAISEHTRQLAFAAVPALPAVEVLHPALEERPAQGTPDAALLGRVGSGFFLIVGRLSSSERYKGHDALIAAMPRVRESFPASRLVVVGDGDDRARLEAQVRERGLADGVVLTGFVSEATRTALYERCAALTMPSTGEGFGLVYLEAMRAGKPCVARARTAAAEIVVHEQTGLLVESPGDQLVAALRSLVGDPDRAARLGKAARQRYLERFGPERFRAGLFQSLDRLVGVT